MLGTIKNFLSSYFRTISGIAAYSFYILPYLMFIFSKKAKKSNSAAFTRSVSSLISMTLLAAFIAPTGSLMFKLLAAAFYSGVRISSSIS